MDDVESDQKPEFIVYQGNRMDAARCDWCGGLASPPSALRAHLERHREREREFKAGAVIISKTFGRMRPL